jgi:hypothetical protein
MDAEHFRHWRTGDISALLGRAFAVEITPRVFAVAQVDEPAFVDVAIRRWERATEKDPVLEETGQTFTEVTEARA